MQKTWENTIFFSRFSFVKHVKHETRKCESYRVIFCFFFVLFLKFFLVFWTSDEHRMLWDFLKLSDRNFFHSGRPKGIFEKKREWFSLTQWACHLYWVCWEYVVRGHFYVAPSPVPTDSGPDFFPINRWSIKSVFTKLIFPRFLIFLTIIFKIDRLF